MNKSVVPKYNSLENKMDLAFSIIDDVVLKNYITELKSMDIVPLDKNILQSNISQNIRIFKINEMVYQKDEYSNYKFESVFNAVAASESAIFIMIDSNGEKTDFYMGIRSINPENSTKTSYATLLSSIKGQFPGIKTRNLFEDEINLLLGKTKASSIAAVSSVANSKNKEQVENKCFIQGLEKLALAMQGQRYTGIIVANPTDQKQLIEIRKRYEEIYTAISPFGSIQMSYGSNSSKNTSKAYTETTSDGESYSKNTSETASRGTSDSDSTSNSLSRETLGSAAGKTLGTSLAVAGAAIGTIIPGVGTLVGGAVGGGIGVVVGSITGRTATNSDSKTSSETESYSETRGESFGTNKTLTKGTTDTEGLTNGSSENLQLTIQNKSILSCLQRIDKQLDRLNEFESLGMWECSAYFMSDSSSTSEIAASTYKALMRGEDSGVEVSAINIWNKRDGENIDLIKDYVTNFMHPVFRYRNNGIEIPVTPAALVSGNELSIHMGLPRKSVCGFPVVEYSDFGKEVITYEERTGNNLNLGNIFNMGYESSTRTLLDLNSLSAHTLIAGSTGSGKSNAVYEILDQLDTLGIKFLIIEPTKGEYKNMFGSKKNVNVFGTNPKFTELIRINPFKFSEGIHVLEHIDRLVEIFNVCWPMYAAMPAVLKEAIIEVYEISGWDMISSENIYSKELFPTFKDLLSSLENVIENSAYSQELKSNYTGALVTRVKSLTNGLNGMIFSSNEIDSELLFDTNVIVDLSRIGSLETKSLIMGILTMRLAEYRACFTDEMNLPLRHVTVLEEAHNILKRTSNNQSQEGSNLTAKSVEMLSNSIAEMRTYGEGFIIIDQSPNAVDMSAIRNTNTKIIMRLPDESDRRLAGKAAALKEEQLDEIAKLPRGVAVVYQNDWLEPVLCKVGKYDGIEKKYVYENELKYQKNIDNTKLLNSLALKFLLKNRVNEHLDFDMDLLENSLNVTDISTQNKIEINKLIEEYKKTGKLELWEEKNFQLLSKLISRLVEGKTILDVAMRTSESHKELTEKIKTSLEIKTDSISEDIKISIIQCILKESSIENPENFEIYSAWVTKLRKGEFI